MRDPGGGTRPSAREEILDRVRAAVDGAPEPAEAPRGYRSRPSRPDGLVALFAERVADYQASVEPVAADDVEAAIARAVAGVHGRVVVPPGLPWSVEGSVLDAGFTALELDDLGAVVTEVALGIAETGTIVLTHDAGQGRRALSLVPDLHVCVVHAEQVVAGVAEAVAALDPDRPQTWISGPSATSDIELDRVEGVHGPRTLHVLLVD